MSNKKSYKNSESNVWQLKQINLHNGDVKVFTTLRSGGNYHMKCWIHADQKYYRKSLKTRDEQLAIRLADEEYITIRAKRIHGERIFKTTFFSVIDEWIKDQQKTVGLNKKQTRITTITSICNWIKAFIGDKNFKIQDLNPRSFVEYPSFRRNKKPNVSPNTLISERASINAIIKFAISKGYLPMTFFLEHAPLKKQQNNRKHLEINEYQKIYRYFGSKGFLEKDNPQKSRHFIRDFVLILANTGLRYGEARRLRWNNIKIVNNEQKPSEPLVEIYLPAEMTKNNKERIVQAKGGKYFTRIKKYSQYTSKLDFVFVDNKTGEELDRNQYYRVWNLMLKETGLKDEPKEISYYCLRHSYATWRLYAGVHPRALCLNMGCGLTYLENHYSHVETRKLREQLTKEIDPEIMNLLKE